MKSIIVPLTLLFTFNSYAQPINESPDDIGIKNPEKTKRFSDDISLQFETEFATVRNEDQDFAITGHTQFYRIELSTRLPYELKGEVGVDYVERDYNDKDSEADRKDGIDNVFFKLRHGTARYKDNGIGDLRIQYRYYYTTDEFFRERYGSDGNYQFRAYMGRPIAGKFYISKFTSYLRYKKYFLNEDGGSRTREYEYRARISPVYRPNRDLEFGITTTYNHVFTREEEYRKVDLGISARQQFGKYAVLFFTSSDLFEEDDNGELESNKDFWNDTTFFLNFNAVIF